MTELAVGECVGPYVVEGIAGEGATATVYRAVHTTLARRVALRVSAEGVDRDRFLRGARVQASVRLPHVVRAIDVLTHELRGREVWIVVLDWVDGVTLHTWLASPDHTPSAALTLAEQLIDGVAGLHRAGVVHRDIKPSNLMVEHGHLWITDFGAAREEVSDPHATLTGGLAGTPRYLPPEVWLGHPSDPFAADVWAVGMVLHELLAGVLPTEVSPQHSGSAAGVLPGHLQERQRDVVRRALSCQAATRPPMEALARAWRGDLAETPRWPVAAAILAVAVVAMAAGLSALPASRPPAAARPTRPLEAAQSAPEALTTRHPAAPVAASSAIAAVYGHMAYLHLEDAIVVDDMTGDGVPDHVLSAPRPAPIEEAGRGILPTVFLMPGGAPDGVGTTKAASASWSWPMGATPGVSARLSDLDGDGSHEVALVGGSVHLLRAAGSVRGVRSLDDDAWFRLDRASPFMNNPEAFLARDVNGDGLADLVVGDEKSREDGISGLAAGGVYVFRAPLVPGAVTTDDRDVMVGGATGDGLGGALAAGHLDGTDGLSLAVGARRYDDERGRLYLIHEPRMEDLRVDLATASWVGRNPRGGLGWTAAFGDLNGDGYDDLVTSAPRHDGWAVDGGAVFVVHGGPTLPRQHDLAMSAEAGLVVASESAENLLGCAVSVGDVDEDGVADLLVGGHHDDPGHPGSAWLWLGRPGLRGHLGHSTADVTYVGLGEGDMFGRRVRIEDRRVMVGAVHARDPRGRPQTGAVYWFEMGRW